MSLDKYIPGSAQGVLANPLVIDVTYAELTDKIALSALVPGQKYRITDYRTAYNMPNVTPAEKIVCTVEPLLVTANSVNSLDTFAYSELYPQDIIYYSPTSDQSMVPGCDMGYIFRRIEQQKSIDIGFDWRNVKFRRWKISGNLNYNPATTYGKLAVVKSGATLYASTHAGNIGNLLSSNSWIELPFLEGDYALWSIQTTYHSYYGVSFGASTLVLEASTDTFDFNVFSTLPTESGVASSLTNIRNITIMQKASDILSVNTVFFGTTFYDIYLGKDTLRNSLRDSFSRNVFEELTTSLIGINFTLNKGDVFLNTVVGANASGNIFGTSFNSNLIGNDFKLNTFVSSVSTSIFYNSNTLNQFNNSVNAIRTGLNFRKDTISAPLTNLSLEAGAVVNADYIKFWFVTTGGAVRANYYNTELLIPTVINPVNDEVTSMKEYTALISETGYSATSGLLIAGQTYYIASYVAGDDFTNVGGTNVTGNTFVASGTTPTAWTNSSILVSVGISAPAVTLLTNGLSDAIVWTYSAVGTYIGTLSGAFTENKTVFSYPPLGDDKSVEVEWTSANVITVKTYETGALKDGLLVKFPLTIKVYP